MKVLSERLADGDCESIKGAEQSAFTSIFLTSIIFILPFF